MNCFRSDLVQPEREKVEGMIERLKSTKGAELVKTCELLAYEVFLPWLNKQNAVNKSYFDECGGIQLLVKLMEHVSTRGRGVTTSMKIYFFYA
jgi:hypothetical protein